MAAVVVVGTLCLASPAFSGAPWLGRYFWVSATQTVAATALLVLPRPWSIVVFVVPALISIGHDLSTQPTWLMGFYYSWYSLVAYPIVAGQLYGLTHFVRVLDDVDRARTELAEVAVDRERLRISRDLHDSLGQSLSAISLKGDLAIRLLPLDAGRARTEIAGLIDIARTALRDLSRISRGAHRVSLGTELDGAAALLAPAGITARIDVDLPRLSAEKEDRRQHGRRHPSGDPERRRRGTGAGRQRPGRPATPGRRPGRRAGHPPEPGRALPADAQVARGDLTLELPEETS
jgi:two-component system sensor histidine kinase DesK